jgi:hypothetical protein
MRVTTDAASLERALKFLRPFKDAHRWDAVSLSAPGGEQLLVKRVGGCGAAITMASAAIEEPGAVVVEFTNLFKLVSAVDGPIIAFGATAMKMSPSLRNWNSSFGKHSRNWSLNFTALTKLVASGMGLPALLRTQKSAWH